MFRIAHASPRFLSPALLASALLAAFALSGVAHALPPAGSDTVNVTGSVSVTSRTGSETVPLTGTATIQLAAPHSKGSVDANVAEITALSLSGISVTGPVTVTESPSHVSDGEIRSISGSSFPATSFFNVYAMVTVPASPNPTITLHNEVPLMFNNPALAGWPMYNATYSATPSPCVLLEPSIYNPAQICISGGTMTLTGAGVGGITELASMPVDEGERVDNTTGNDHVVGIAVVLALFAAFGVVANFARAKLRSDR